uniref:Uncharacterized protein n=1 Tax=viral metagenome TaxID=1070528 RepID=A0A6C0BXA4_9ZZZZ
MAFLVMNIFSLDSNSFIISVAFTLLMSGLIVYLMNTKISRIEKNIQNQNHVLTGIINGLQEDMRSGTGSHRANDTISNSEVCNREVCNSEVCNREVCNSKVCNSEVSNISEKDHLGDKINVSSDDDYSSDSSDEDSSDEDETATSSNKKITLDVGRTDCIDQQHYLNEMARNTFTIGAEPAVDSLAVDSLAVDSLAVDSLAVDSLAVDSLAVDSLAVDENVGGTLVTVADSSDSDSGEDSDSDDDNNLGTGVNDSLEMKSIGIENPISAKPLGINLNKLKVPELKALVVDKVLASPDSANNMKKKDLLGLLKKSGGEKGATTS